MVAGAAASTSRSSVGPLVQPQLCCLCKPRWHLVRCFFSSPEVWPAHGHPACWRLHTGVQRQSPELLAGRWVSAHPQACAPSLPSLYRKWFHKASAQCFCEFSGFTTQSVRSASNKWPMIAPYYWPLLLGTTSSCQPEQMDSQLQDPWPSTNSLQVWYVKTDCSQTVLSAEITTVAHSERAPLWPLFCPTEIRTHNPWSPRLGIQRQIIFATNGAHGNYCLLKCIVKNESKAFRCQSKFHLN